MEHSIIIAGSGGQGILFLGRLMAYATMLEGKEVTWMPSYGAEMRGGTANCTVIISDEMIGSPVVRNPAILVAMNDASYNRFACKLLSGGTLLYDSSLIKRTEHRNDIKALGVPASMLSSTLNSTKLANMVLMGAIVAFAAACVSWEIKDREKEFYILLLVMTGGILGAFASLDLFFFYFFHELALVPTFIMIGVWGRGEQKNYATFQITLYLSIGALIALIGLIALYLQSGAGTFDIPTLMRFICGTPENRFTDAHPLAGGAQRFIFPLLLFGFGILVSLWPFHTWAPLGYGCAPAPTAMLHAGVLKKFGLYGLLRIALPLMPQAAQHWMPILAWLCLGNILYVGWVAMRQRDLNLLFGNSSVAHMGVIFLGLASLNLLGVTGAVVIMVAHGFLAALLFGLSGYLRQQTGTLEMDRLGGLAGKLRFIGVALTMAALAGCGLPGFANFVGEVSVFFGAWKAFPFITVLALWGGLVIGGIYMTRAVRNILHGPLPEKWNSITAVTHLWRKLPYALLLACLLVFGFLPKLLTEKINPDAEKVVSSYTQQVASSPSGDVKPKADSTGDRQLAIENK